MHSSGSQSVRPQAFGTVSLGAILLALAAGCSDDPAAAETAGDSAGGSDAAPPAPSALFEAALACGSRDFTACDVLDPVCQQTLADIAACQWGGEGTPTVLPPINTFTSAELLAQLTANSAASSDEGEGPAPAQQGFGVLLEWLGLAQPSDLTAESTNQLVASLYLALYDPATKQATLIEDARSENAASNDEVLFHELVHAQQDARYDLASILAGVNSVDSLIGRRSLVEGEALFHQILFDFGALDMPLTATNLQRAMEGLRSSEEASWMADPATAWTRSLVLASYVYGQFLVRDGWLEGGPEGMVARFADPPTESLRMLEAAFAREPTTDRIWAYPAPSIFATAGQALPVPGDEQYPIAVDRLGAWTLYVLASLAGEDDVARALGTGWRGDELDLFQLQDGGFAGRLRVSVDTVDNANELARLLSAKANVEVRTNGTFVVAALAAQPAKPDWLFGPLEAP